MIVRTPGRFRASAIGCRMIPITALIEDEGVTKGLFAVDINTDSTRRAFCVGVGAVVGVMALVAAGSAWAVPLSFVSIALILLHVNAFYLVNRVELVPRWPLAVSVLGALVIAAVTALGLLSPYAR